MKNIGLFIPFQFISNIIKNLYFIPKIKTSLISSTKKTTFNLILFFMFFILVLPSQVMGAISCTNTSGTAVNPSGTTFSWSHTVSAGSNGCLVVIILSPAGPTTSTVTYNGSSMTKEATYSTSGVANGEWTVWRLLSPSTGSNTVAVTLGSGNWNTCSGSGFSFTDCSGVGNTSMNNSAAVGQTTSVTISANSMIIGSCFAGNNTTAYMEIPDGTNKSLDYNHNMSNYSWGARSSSLSSGSKTIQGGSTATSVIMAIEVKEVVALPVEFSFFKTEFVHDHVKINWQTTTETNNDYFIIERSKNGNTWENVDRIDGAKNSTQVSNYHFDDKTPYLGTSYYRLKQMDIDGKYTYSEIKTVNVDLIDHDEIHVNPNPTTGSFTIKGDQINIADIEIFDINGKDVTEHVKIQKTENDIHVDLESLNDGVYILKVKDTFSVKIDKI